MKPSLRDVQSMFWTLITAPEGARSGLQTLGMTEEKLEAVVRSNDRLAAIDRLDVYANMYFFRLLEVLQEDFPKLRSVVGDDRFHNLVTDYLLACPSRSPSLRFLGDRVSDYLDGHLLAETYPFAGDLARLEWARIEAFDAADGSVLTLDDLRGIAPERWPELRFSPTSSLAIFELSWPVHRVWLALEQGQTFATPERADTLLRVWRQGFDVYHCAMDPHEARLLNEVAAGTPWGDVCGLIAEGAGAEDNPAEIAFELLHGWIVDGLFSAAL